MKDLIEQLGEQLLREAINSSGMVAKEKVDIFKAVSLWYLGLSKKPKGDSDDDPEGGETFDRIAKRLNGKAVAQ